MTIDLSNAQLRATTRLALTRTEYEAYKLTYVIMYPLLLRRPNLMVYMKPSGDVLLETGREKPAVLFFNLLSVKYSILSSSDRTDVAATLTS